MRKKDGIETEATSPEKGKWLPALRKRTAETSDEIPWRLDPLSRFGLPHSETSFIFSKSSFSMMDRWI
jgi:hypothetical protein